MSTLLQLDSDYTPLFTGFLKLAADDDGDFRDVHIYTLVLFFHFIIILKNIIYLQCFIGK